MRDGPADGYDHVMSTSQHPSEFSFAFTRRYQLAALPFGVTPWTSGVRLDEQGLRVRYGPWRLQTDLDNLAHAALSGDFLFAKTAGPPRFSFADRGISFTPNGDAAVCVLFGTSVPCLDPTDLLWPLRHTGATLGVADVVGFLERCDELGVPVG